MKYMALIIFILTGSVAACAYTDETLVIPHLNMVVGGSMETFMSTLKSKGFKEQKNEGAGVYTIMRGTYAGRKDTDIYVRKSRATNQVVAVDIYIYPQYPTWKSLLAEYEYWEKEFHRLYDSKYTVRIDKNENNYNEIYGYKNFLTEIDEGTATYEDVVEGNVSYYMNWEEYDYTGKMETDPTYVDLLIYETDINGEERPCVRLSFVGRKDWKSYKNDGCTYLRVNRVLEDDYQLFVGGRLEEFLIDFKEWVDVSNSCLYKYKEDECRLWVRDSPLYEYDIYYSPITRTVWRMDKAEIFPDWSSLKNAFHVIGREYLDASNSKTVMYKFSDSFVRKFNSEEDMTDEDRIRAVKEGEAYFMKQDEDDVSRKLLRMDTTSLGEPCVRLSCVDKKNADIKNTEKETLSEKKGQNTVSASVQVKKEDKSVASASVSKSSVKTEMKYPLYFEGILIGGSLEEFREKMEDAGYRYVSSDGSVMKMKGGKGMLFGAEDEVEVRASSRGVYMVQVYDYNIIASRSLSLLEGQYKKHKEYFANMCSARPTYLNESYPSAYATAPASAVLQAVKNKKTDYFASWQYGGSALTGYNQLEVRLYPNSKGDACVLLTWSACGR